MNFSNWFKSNDDGLKPIKGELRFVATPDGKIFYPEADWETHSMIWQSRAKPYAIQKFPNMSEKDIESDYMLRGIIRNHDYNDNSVLGSMFSRKIPKREVYLYRSINNGGFITPVLQTMIKDRYLSPESRVRDSKTLGDETISVEEFMKQNPPHSMTPSQENPAEIKNRAEKTTWDQIRAKFNSEEEYQAWRTKMAQTKSQPKPMTDKDWQDEIQRRRPFPSTDPSRFLK